MRVVGRSRERLAAAFSSLGDRVEMVAADLETPGGAATACAGADTVFFTLGLPYHEFARYPALMKTVVGAAIAAGVRRMLLVTNIYPYGLPQAARVTEDHPRAPVAFKGKMRLEQEEILMAADRAGHLRGIVLRLPDFFGFDAELSYAKLIFDAAAGGKPANLFAPADTPHQFVYVPDVGPVAVDLASRDEAWGEVFHFAGSGDITVRDFATRVFRAAGAEPRFRMAGKTLIRVLGVFDKIMREFVEMFYLQTNPVMLDDAKLTRLLGTVRRTSYEDGIRETLAAMRA